MRQSAGNSVKNRLPTAFLAQRASARSAPCSPRIRNPVLLKTSLPQPGSNRGLPPGYSVQYSCAAESYAMRDCPAEIPDVTPEGGAAERLTEDGACSRTGTARQA